MLRRGSMLGSLMMILVLVLMLLAGFAPSCMRYNMATPGQGARTAAAGAAAGSDVVGHMCQRLGRSSLRHPWCRRRRV
jgi:hypothetical protein